MNSAVGITLAMVLVGGGCNKDAGEQRLQDRPMQQLTNSAADTSAWRTYVNKKFQFEFKYPSHWREATTVTDKANIIWINFSSSSAGATKGVLYVKVFPDRTAYSIEERLIAANATSTQITVDNTVQHLYGDFLDIPTVMISNNDLLVEIGDPSREGALKQILTTFRFTH